jgi:hypothetical protein
MIGVFCSFNHTHGDYLDPEHSLKPRKTYL